MKTARHFLIAVLGLIVLQLADCEMKSLGAQVVAYTTLSSATHGMTICTEDNKPLIILAESDRGTPMEKVVRTHEQVHVRQILAYPGGCHAAVIRYRTDPVFRFNQEFEAYCENARATDGDHQVIALALTKHMISLYPDVFKPGDVLIRSLACVGGT